MMEMVIEKGIIIDNISQVRKELQNLSNKKIHDLEVVKRFICNEKYTKYYMDKTLKSSTECQSISQYLWLDTGFRDEYGNPLFISLMRRGQEFVGHVVETARNLCEVLKHNFPSNKKYIEKNYARFLTKYEMKCEERQHVCIESENQYLLQSMNGDDCGSELARKISMLNVEWVQDEEEEEQIEVKEPEEEKFTESEEEITIGLLLEMVDQQEKYIQELLTHIEKTTLEKDEETNRLIGIIKEQSEAITRIRLFEETEALLQSERDMRKEEKQKEKAGHRLLKAHKKILILGDSNLSVEVMRGILTKEYGFEKNDIVFETDYQKIVNSAGRAMNSSRYQAIVLGCCPHSTRGKGSWSSIIEGFKKEQGAPFVVDARNLSGNLRVTKESFRRALDEICENFLEVA